MEITFPGNKRVDVSDGKFVIHTDQSSSHGGDGSAPEPFTLFLASLGACAGIYVLSFCQTRGIPTEGLKLTQEAEFQDKTLAKVSIRIHVPESFPKKYLAAVQAAAEKCAVKRAMDAQPPIEVSTVQAGTPQQVRA